VCTLSLKLYSLRKISKAVVTILAKNSLIKIVNRENVNRKSAAVGKSHVAMHHKLTGFHP
jgi:hypothetical protein